ncbi:hypothetical protein DL764_010658 [Monosporascus ibericus]|uniref:GOLD domain-containing protein n=1 Tax=Monosporascus ibericus TaxID=155417 RepID=A0A4Q4SSD2_9PEZI|nr:hypothetical protein DL764_010658 [Monosporascus ibericus]
MRGLFKAAVILAAPVLAAALPFTQQDTSHALVVEDLFRFDILESEAACGYGNITVDGQALHQDENGLGFESIITERGNNVVAKWKFTCIERDDGYQEQLLSFNLITVDDEVRDVEFAVQFRQVAPVVFTSLVAIDGAQYIIKVPESSSDKVGSIDRSAPLDLEEELDILELMKLRLLDLERAIARKEQYLSETFNFHGNSAGDSKHSLVALYMTLIRRAECLMFPRTSSKTNLKKARCPAPPSEHLVDTKLAIGLLAGVVVLGLAISSLRTRCFASTRKRWHARRRRCSEKRATRRAALEAVVRRLVQRLHERLQRWQQQRWGRSLGDEEKDAALPCQSPRPHHHPRIETPTTEEDKPEQRHAPPPSDSGDLGDESDGSDGSDLSTTLEQELAQFRAVAGVVGDLVTAEEGRRSRAAASAARSRLPALASTYRYDIYTRARAAAEPPSPISVSSCPPEYASSDETLPPYNEGPSDPHFVADGFNYAPGSAAYMPGYGSEAPSSLDEHLGRLG